MNKDEVKKLADLARIEIADEEASRFGTEMEEILGYVKQVQEIDFSKSGVEDMSELEEKSTAFVRNILREDNDAHESGIHTDDILKEAPSLGSFAGKDENNDKYIKTKKILG